MIEKKINGESLNILEENISKLKELFPEILTEDKIDFDKLKTILSEEIDDSPERYNFTWHGKSKAIAEAQKPSTGTLRPVKEESKDWNTTENLYIEGDNLEVLKLLQKTYYNKIKMIYIDPPYNTGKDFIYPDNYKDNLENYLELTGQAAPISEHRREGEREREQWN
ncbi:MAG: DNA methyltransferase [Methanobrevibacter sp.]|jgi:adenine-specific DNA-methyltransferase|nr:DNA methyltransferase [Candidatus Methanovirga procula]